MTTPEFTDRRPTLVDAQRTVRDFLKQSLPDVHRVDVTKVLWLGSAPAAWEALAVVWQPNSVIQSLGLCTERPVLDQHAYLVRLDERLNVIGYETQEAESAS
jgi:hypothetical protein